MAPVKRLLILVGIGGLASSVAAVEIVRCTTADGEVRYQDRPCAAGEAVHRIQLVDDPPQASTSTTPQRNEAEDVGQPVAAMPGAAALAPTMPSSWLCRRGDGSRYLSDTGIGERRAVPLAMLGVPGRSLADAYGPGGAGVSAPGLRQPGIDRSADAQIGAAYVWVEDACEPVDAGAACRFLEGEIDAAEYRLRRAFSDTSAQVRAEIAALRERAAACR
ncbi:DUF4124 domain-containing protein [Dokdonella sp.]|uniref:DUF4124 domain-containing protein n=1 Tax=Dokdonella sp. TaxID=2291710 RepID=UPI0025BEF158|nr:DUF4124 domain-containing protein [Dokdonella sp.]MBX3691063.1 DUF4124 domain-containing protein [Dokdonella sp.]